MKPQDQINAIHQTAALCINTLLPKGMVKEIENSLQGIENHFEKSQIKENGDDKEDAQLDIGLRNSSNAWISPQHWISGMCWHYVMQANRDKWKFDLDPLEHPISYLEYEAGQYYRWHVDSGAPGQFEETTVVSVVFVAFSAAPA